ncbi:MAG: hypothetical protein NT025_01515 [bacterium]|jgi:hypothetical protein|nr:hypothetical protein [bacterium]
MIPMISVFIVILIATRKQHKPWSELTAKQKITTIGLVSAGALLFVAAVVVAFLY